MYPIASQTPDLQMLQTPMEDLVQQDTQMEDEEARKEQEKRDEADEQELNDIVLELVKIAEKEDEDIRWPLLSKCKRNDYYFNNIQTIFFDAVAQDYRTIDSALSEMQKQGMLDIKEINVYRAHAESLIAALSTEVPRLDVAPDDAENPDDIETADTYIKAAEIISKHNAAALLLIKSLTIQYNCGTVFGYNYYKQDPAYGHIRKPKTLGQVKQKVFDIRCKYCTDLLDSGVYEDKLPNYQNVECPSCDYVGPPSIYARWEYQTEVVEWEDTPKGRSGLDIFGPNYVKAPMYARKQENVGYLILRLEDHKAKYKTVYDEYRDKIDSETGDTERYERWSRIPPDYYGSMPRNLCTGRYAWIRPWYYAALENDDKENLLLDKFPNGFMATVIGETVVELKSEKLDDHWTISFDPRSNFIHGEAPGNSSIPLQDSTTDIFNLGIQSIEFGIPETFVHPRTVNLEKYSKTQAAPGMMVNALPPEPGKQLSEGFHTVQASSLSGEYSIFAKDLTASYQFVTGDFPSIFGGVAGTDTATEYVESQGRALQRLQLTWAFIKHFWSHLLFKATSDYLNQLQEDDHFTDKKNGNWVNTWIRKTSLNGKVGHVEPEMNGQLPQSWAQKKDFLMKLIQLKDPMIGQIVLHPNNTELLKQAIGTPDFYIPGEKDRNKQWAEFYIMAQQQPVGQNQSSVQIDIDVDDHQVHMMVLKDILVSPLGMQLYKDNPAAYENCIFHYRAHEMANQAKTIAPAENSGAGEQPPSASQQ